MSCAIIHPDLLPLLLEMLAQFVPSAADWVNAVIWLATPMAQSLYAVADAGLATGPSDDPMPVASPPTVSAVDPAGVTIPISEASIGVDVPCAVLSVKVKLSLPPTTGEASIE